MCSITLPPFFAPGKPGAPPLAFHAVQVHPMTMRPESRGRLGLRSGNADDPPKFLANALSHEADLDTLRRGVRLAREIFDTSPLKGLVAEEIFALTRVPGVGKARFFGDGKLELIDK